MGRIRGPRTRTNLYSDEKMASSHEHVLDVLRVRKKEKFVSYVHHIVYNIRWQVVRQGIRWPPFTYEIIRNSCKITGIVVCSDEVRLGYTGVSRRARHETCCPDDGNVFSPVKLSAAAHLYDYDGILNSLVCNRWITIKPLEDTRVRIWI